MNASSRHTGLFKSSTRQIAPFPVPQVSTPPERLARLHNHKTTYKREYVGEILETNSITAMETYQPETAWLAGL